MKEKISLFAFFAIGISVAQSVPNSNQGWETSPRQLNSLAAARPQPTRSYEDLQRTGPYLDPLASGINAPTLNLQAPELTSTRIAPPITTKSEFESFADDAAGHALPVYGRQLFDEVPTTFAPMDRVPVPADYLIGPGDELLIRVWGKVELQSRVVIDRNGQIFLPKVGTLTLAGLRYDQIDSCVRAAIAKLYKDFDLNVTVGQLRSIQIFVLGSARQPGVYTVSALSTMVNALFASGGPSATGTMRHIELRRGGHTVTEFDIYDLLRNGDKSHDAQLLSGDILYIPPVGPQTAILGSVKEPGIYELKDGTTIASILKDVGGLSNLASSDRVLLERIENHRWRQVDEFALDGSGMQRHLRDGDILRIFPIPPRFENAVILRGNVAQPGRYLWREGMRISDLIPTRDTLLTRDYWNQQNSLANTLPVTSFKQQGNVNPQDYPTSLNGPNAQRQLDVAYSPKNDSNAIANDYPPQRREHWDRPKSPIDFQTHDVMADLTQTNTEVNWGYASIERRDEKDLTTRIIAFNLGNAIDQPKSSDDYVLEKGDVVTIFSQKDAPLPQNKHAAFVRIGGEVNAPGVYRITPGETLRRLVERAGGLAPNSYLYASQLSRVSTRQAQEEELRISTAQMQKEVASRFASVSSLSPANTAEQQAQLSAQQALIAQLSSMHPSGRIVLEMKPDAASIEDIPDFALEDGDNFFVPAKLGTVQVSGAVYNEAAFRFRKNMRVSTFLKAAGGPTRQADAKRVFLIRADGTVISRQHHSSPWGSNFEEMRVLPGDSIVVPTKLKSPTSFMQQLPFMTQILSQTAMTGAVIGTSY
jgi:protein involved in polysaccharide export with SLBB domain